MANQKKLSYVASLSEKLSQNPHFIVVNFKQITHQRLEDLRAKLREQEAAKGSIMMLKNSLFKLALQNSNKKSKIISDEQVKQMGESMKGQAGLLMFAGDWMQGLKTIFDFIKDDEQSDFLAGALDGQVYEKEGLMKLAKLPSRNELAIKVILSLRSSHMKLVYGMKYSASKLVYVLQNAKPNDAPAAVEAPAEAPKEAVAEESVAVEAPKVEETAATEVEVETPEVEVEAPVVEAEVPVTEEAAPAEEVVVEAAAE